MRILYIYHLGYGYVFVLMFNYYHIDVITVTGICIAWLSHPIGWVQLLEYDSFSYL